MTPEGNDAGSAAERPYDPYVAKLVSADTRTLGAYAARRCPVRTQLRFDPPSDATVAPPGAAQQRRAEKGREFERITAAAFDQALRIVGANHDELIANTVIALEAGVPIIVDGRLPDDLRSRRTGRPDMLVRATATTLSASGKPAYWPVDIKNHGVLIARKGLPALLSPVDAPFAENASVIDGRCDVNDEKRRNDLLQLAHYWRMLEACGHAAPSGGPVWGGIIGSDQAGVVWADLNVPRFRSNGARFRDETESALRRYDFEFAFRLDIAATATQHRNDPAVPLLTDPMKCAECANCEWRDHCIPELMEASGDVSLLPHVGYRQWSALRRLGFRSRADVASIGRTSARVIDAFPSNLSLVDALDAAGRHEPSTPLKGVFGKRAVRQLRAFEANGIATAGDLAALGSGALALHGEITNVTELVDTAWIAVHGGGQPFRRRGVDSTAVPRADIEIDIDMENDFQGGTYLWGALLTNRYETGRDEPTGYRPFVGWALVTPEIEVAIFEAFWEWLRGVIEAARAAGLTVKVYCWHDAAEIGKLRRAALLTGDPERFSAEVRGLVADSEVWVDMEREFNRVAIGADGSGLKKIAPFAGAGWDDADAGGDTSMTWHEFAVEGDRAARSRLLRYNEDDVRACFAIREWLCDDQLPNLPD